MIYTKPEDVIYPRKYLSDLQIIDEGSEDRVAVAKMKWEGEPAMGIRWNVTNNEKNVPNKKAGLQPCVGHPFSSAHPVWCVLPSLKDCSFSVRRQIRKHMGLTGIDMLKAMFRKSK